MINKNKQEQIDRRKEQGESLRGEKPEEDKGKREIFEAIEA